MNCIRRIHVILRENWVDRLSTVFKIEGIDPTDVISLHVSYDPESNKTFIDIFTLEVI